MTTRIRIRDVLLSRGNHARPEDGMCIIELAAYLSPTSTFTDHPACVSPVIAAFLRLWNDQLDDATRQKLKPYARKVLNTATTKADETARAWLATDWLVRECAPGFLRLAGLAGHAETLEELAALTGTRQANTAQTSIAAARAAAGDAAWDAAGDAARAAARAAARDAARAALAPTVKTLQKSAFCLLDRMIEVGKS